jgi:copper transport protein
VKFRAALAVLLWAAAALLAWIPDARAHASLVTVEPADGAVIETSPAELVLTFSEPVQLLVARLVGPGGRQRLLQGVHGQGRTVLVPLPRDLTIGTHLLSWRVASPDGHPVAGASTFVIGMATSGTATAVASDRQVQALLWLARLGLAIGTTFGIGGAFFAGWIATGPLPGMARHARTLALAVGVTSVLPALALQGLDMLGGSLADLASASTWHAGIVGSPYGPTILLLDLAFALALAAGWLCQRLTGRLLAGGSLAIACAGIAMSGHAATAGPAWLTCPAVFLHAAMVTFWLGALVPLLALVRIRAAGADATLARFSRVVPAALLLLLASGLLLSVRQLGRLEALTGTAYGDVLLAKLGLVLLLLALGGVNRWRLGPRWQSGKAKAGRLMTRTIAVEAGVAVAILAVVGLWRFTPPPRALAPAAPDIQVITASRDGVTAQLALVPPAPGPVRVEVTGLERDGRALSPAEVTVEMGKPAFGIGPLTRKAVRTGDGRWVADGFVLPMDGHWVASVKLLVSDFESLTLTDAFEVRAAAAP